MLQALCLTNDINCRPVLSVISEARPVNVDLEEVRNGLDIVHIMHQSIESLGGGAGTWPGNTVLLLNTA